MMKQVFSAAVFGVFPTLNLCASLALAMEATTNTESTLMEKPINSNDFQWFFLHLICFGAFVNATAQPVNARLITIYVASDIMLMLMVAAVPHWTVEVFLQRVKVADLHSPSFMRGLLLLQIALFHYQLARILQLYDATVPSDVGLAQVEPEPEPNEPIIEPAIEPANEPAIEGVSAVGMTNEDVDALSLQEPTESPDLEVVMASKGFEAVTKQDEDEAVDDSRLMQEPSKSGALEVVKNAEVATNQDEDKAGPQGTSNKDHGSKRPTVTEAVTPVGMTNKDVDEQSLLCCLLLELSPLALADLRRLVPLPGDTIHAVRGIRLHGRKTMRTDAYVNFHCKSHCETIVASFPQTVFCENVQLTDVCPSTSPPPRRPLPHWAVQFCANLDVSMVTYICETDPNAIQRRGGVGLAPDDDGSVGTLLHAVVYNWFSTSTATLRKRLEIVRFLIKECPQALEMRDSRGRLPLQAAAMALRGVFDPPCVALLVTLLRGYPDAMEELRQVRAEDDARRWLRDAVQAMDDAGAEALVLKEIRLQKSLKKMEQEHDNFWAVRIDENDHHPCQIIFRDHWFQPSTHCLYTELSLVRAKLRAMTTIAINGRQD